MTLYILSASMFEVPRFEAPTSASSGFSREIDQMWRIPRAKERFAHGRGLWGRDPGARRVGVCPTLKETSLHEAKQKYNIL
jgi:hypothetical protein